MLQENKSLVKQLISAKKSISACLDNEDYNTDDKKVKTSTFCVANTSDNQTDLKQPTHSASSSQTLYMTTKENSSRSYNIPGQQPITFNISVPTHAPSNSASHQSNSCAISSDQLVHHSTHPPFI